MATERSNFFTDLEPNEILDEYLKYAWKMGESIVPESLMNPCVSQSGNKKYRVEVYHGYYIDHKCIYIDIYETNGNKCVDRRVIYNPGREIIEKITVNRSQKFKNVRYEDGMFYFIKESVLRKIRFNLPQGCEMIYPPYFSSYHVVCDCVDMNVCIYLKYDDDSEGKIRLTFGSNVKDNTIQMKWDFSEGIKDKEAFIKILSEID